MVRELFSLHLTRAERVMIASTRAALPNGRAPMGETGKDVATKPMRQAKSSASSDGGLTADAGGASVHVEKPEQPYGEAPPSTH